MTSSNPCSANDLVETAQQLEIHFANIPANPKHDYNQEGNRYNVRRNATSNLILAPSPQPTISRFRRVTSVNDSATRTNHWHRECPYSDPNFSYQSRIYGPTHSTETALCLVYQSPLALKLTQINQCLWLIWKNKAINSSSQTNSCQFLDFSLTNKSIHWHSLKALSLSHFLRNSTQIKNKTSSEHFHCNSPNRWLN